MGVCWRPTWTTLRMPSLYRQTSATGARASTTPSMTRLRRAAVCACSCLLRARGTSAMGATLALCCLQGTIHQSIEWLDKLGMDTIEQARPARLLQISTSRSERCSRKHCDARGAQGSPQAFAEYLRRYGNTICGRYPIGLFLNVRWFAYACCMRYTC